MAGFDPSIAGRARRTASSGARTRTPVATAGPTSGSATKFALGEGLCRLDAARREPAPRTGRRLCAGGSYRAPCTEPAPRMYQVRAAIPWRTMCVFHRRGRQRTTYRTWPTGPLRSASRIPDRGHRQRLARPSDAPRFGRRHRARRSRSKSPHPPVDRGGPSNGRYRVTGSTSPAATTSPPQSGHVAGDGSRTSTAKRVRHPEHRPGRVSRRLGCIAGR